MCHLEVLLVVVTIAPSPTVRVVPRPHLSVVVTRPDGWDEEHAVLRTVRAQTGPVRHRGSMREPVGREVCVQTVEAALPQLEPILHLNVES